MRYIFGLLAPFAFIVFESSVLHAAPMQSEAVALEYRPNSSQPRDEVSRLSVSQQAPSVRPRNPAFEVPAKLRARVNFWIDIFTVYGKGQVVFHHRDFPQAVFTVLDFSAEQAQMSAVGFERFKESRVKAQIRQIETILLALGRGEQAHSTLERNVSEAMQLVPGGNAKFVLAVKEGLVRSQTGIREKYAEAIKRANRYMHLIERIFVEDFGLPVELTRLPFIESSFDYQAYSSVGAAGIWQFMRSTGRKYMTVNSLIDERRDVLAATRAAARYLHAAFKSLGSWPLAVTSYNHGVAGVYRKVRQFGSSDIASIVEDPKQRVFGFASSNFFPEFLAALEVYDQRKQYFPEVIEDPPLQVREVQLTQPVSVNYILKRYPQINIAELRAANYAISDAIWNGRYKIPQGYTLKVPSQVAVQAHELRGDAAQKKAAAQSAPPASAVYGGTSYTVRPGDTLFSLARKYGTNTKAIMELNNLSSPVLRVGQMLQIRAPGTPTPTAQQEAKSESKAQSESKRYIVKSGDSLWSISRSLGVSLDALKRANPSKAAKLKPGQSLIVP